MVSVDTDKLDAQSISSKLPPSLNVKAIIPLNISFICIESILSLKKQNITKHPDDFDRTYGMVQGP